MSVYLDHNATALPDAQAARAAAEALLAGAGNPSSVHSAGRRARAQLEAARASVAESLGARPRDLVFTSGATEALHLAIGGMVAAGGHVVCSALEHPAVEGALRVAGAAVTRVGVDGAGRVRPSDFAAALRPETRLVALMAAQNEIGNLYPVAEVAAAVAPVPLLCDAVQRFGRLPTSVEALGAALVVVSAHKIGGPPGAGALWIRPGLCLEPRQAGGAQERGRRAGTENLPAAIGFGVACQRLSERLSTSKRQAGLIARASAGLRALRPDVVFHGDAIDRLPNTLSFRFPGVPGDVLLAALDLAGFSLSSGSACSSGALEPSAVLRALGLPPEQAGGAVRLSVGPETSPSDIDALLAVLPQLLDRIVAAAARHGRL